MITRISTSLMQNNLVSQISNNQNKLYDLQIQAMTGKKVNSILDNPVDAAKILTLIEEKGKIASYKTNVGVAQGEYDAMDSTLATVIEKMQRVYELSSSAANEYNSADTLQAIKSEVTSIKETIITLANTQYDGRYIFSGTNTGTPSFTLAEDGTITYGGTPATGDYKRQVEVADGTYLTLNAAGDSVFGSYDAATDTGTGVFAMLSTFENALENACSEDEDVSAEGFEAIRECINTSQDSIRNVTNIRTQYGTFAQKADLSENSLDDTSILLESDRSDLQDVDLAEAYSNLVYQQYALQASMKIGSMTMQQSSLLNYI